MAPFYINGSTGISGVDGSAATPALQGTDTNTGIAFGSDVILGSTGGTERFRCDSSGRLLVGTSTARSNIFNSSSITSNILQIEKASDSAGLSIITNNDSSGTAYLALCRSKGTALGSNTLVASGDVLGTLTFQGSDGTEFVDGARIEAYVDGTSGANDLPTRLVFSTTADGASSPTERLRLTAAGLFQSMPIYNTTGGDAANVVVNSSGTVYRSTSSAKYKTDIETLQDQYADAILMLRPVWYRSTCEIDNPDWSYWGFIAEEVAEIDSRLVSWKTTETSYDENGAVVQTQLETPEPEGVQYDRFVPHLLNLIKRQKEQIEAMEARLSALEGA